MLDALKQAFNHHIMFTNLVRVRYKTDFGLLTLKALYARWCTWGRNGTNDRYIDEQRFALPD